MSNLASYISLVLMGNTVVVRKEKSPLYVSSVPIESETCEDQTSAELEFKLYFSFNVNFVEWPIWSVNVCFKRLTQMLLALYKSLLDYLIQL